jgi:type I restriction enzyme R subunit
LVKARIAGLRQQHGVHGEMKWRKVSPSKLGLYTDFIDLFIGHVTSAIIISPPDDNEGNEEVDEE